MSTIKFDHTKRKLSDSMDIDEVQLDNMAKRIAAITTKYDNAPDFNKSHVAEALAQTISYKELLFFTTGYIHEIVEKKRGIDPKLKMALVMSALLSKSKE